MPAYPSVSVIIPTRDDAQDLAERVSRAMDQQHPGPLEIRLLPSAGDFLPVMPGQHPFDNQSGEICMLSRHVPQVADRFRRLGW